MKVFDDRPCELGEGAIWHPERGQFFWFDILGRRLLSRDASGPLEWRLDRMSSAAGWVDRDRFLIADETGLLLFDLRDESLRPLVAIEADDTATRSNDGRADRQGGFWIGTMGKGGEPDRGAIYRYYRGELRRLIAPISIPNAICFSPDGTTAYFADTAISRVWTWRLDADGWPVGEPALFLDLTDAGLSPDGAVIDSAGAFCVACWGAGKVVRFSRRGERLDEMPVGGAHSSCPSYGGSDLRDVLVTTALQDIRQPDRFQGLTFITRASVPGLPEPRVLL
ncbi:SMP-30/gluconolactonase/LRE family protein [Paracoccus aurantiacus]|uniref:SMP-30/gluconolactonase/LRE family protein n=1 Tax=Paracoccus aurantiacus TaxID=2599412 RepID=A0A5C6RQ22_9RHOB|nr:SMP-30/gluconolactonase/LRE family protein [Paracoccus aurantiacus]TXB64064.1 SMP-30/gluconolactonase/LRE family protein [Paracoccus aurantiacus]